MLPAIRHIPEPQERVKSAIFSTPCLVLGRADAARSRLETTSDAPSRPLKTFGNRAQSILCRPVPSGTIAALMISRVSTLPGFETLHQRMGEFAYRLHSKPLSSAPFHKEQPIEDHGVCQTRDGTDQYPNRASQ